MSAISGLGAWMSAVDGMAVKVFTTAEASTAEAARLVQQTAKDNLALTSHERGTPTPSVPGSPPSMISGDLRDSVKVVGPESISGFRWRAQVGPTMPYGRIQELGGHAGHANLPARPYMAPSLDQSLDEIREIFVQAVHVALFH